MPKWSIIEARLTDSQFCTTSLTHSFTLHYFTKPRVFYVNHTTNAFYDTISPKNEAIVSSTSKPPFPGVIVHFSPSAIWWFPLLKSTQSIALSDIIQSQRNYRGNPRLLSFIAQNNYRNDIYSAYPRISILALTAFILVAKVMIVFMTGFSSSW